MNTTEIAEAVSELTTRAAQMEQRTMQTLSDSSLHCRGSYECSAAARLVAFVQEVLNEITGSVRLLELAEGNEDALKVKWRQVESLVLWVGGLLARAEAKLQ